MSTTTLRHFGVFFDRYYWQTAILIARNGLARQYRNSFLGMLWTLLQPLAMVLIYALIMPLIMKRAVFNYPLYMIVSFPLWNYFTNSLFFASHSILNNGETLKRCMVSSTVFPVADLLRNTYTYITSFLTMYVVALVLLISPSPVLLLMPFYLIPIVITMASICVAVAFLAPYLRDLGDFIQVGMNMMFWLTPVIYSIDNLPPWVQSLMLWNPFYIMMRPIQLIAYSGQMPGIDDILRLLALMLVAIAVGFGIFKACRRNYVYYL